MKCSIKSQKVRDKFQEGVSDQLVSKMHEFGSEFRKLLTGIPYNCNLHSEKWSGFFGLKMDHSSVFRVPMMPQCVRDTFLIIRLHPKPSLQKLQNPRTAPFTNPDGNVSNVHVRKFRQKVKIESLKKYFQIRIFFLYRIRCVDFCVLKLHFS